jgi:hypothetical protein
MREANALASQLDRLLRASQVTLAHSPGSEASVKRTAVTVRVQEPIMAERTAAHLLDRLAPAREPTLLLQYATEGKDFSSLKRSLIRHQHHYPRLRSPRIS